MHLANILISLILLVTMDPGYFYMWTEKTVQTELMPRLI